MKALRFRFVFLVTLGHGFSPEVPSQRRHQNIGRLHLRPHVVNVSPKQVPKHEECDGSNIPLLDLTRLMSSIPSTSAGLDSLELGCVVFIERLYSKTMAIKCPFFRRRAADILDSLDMIVRFLVIRHKSLDIVGPPPSWRAPNAATIKRRGLPVGEVAEIIRRDWRVDTNKGYYVTGKLNSTIYRDDCVFDGPDPDMPVRGLRKYLNAASQLFDQGKSRAELLSLEIIDDNEIVAKWRMNGILRLPWKPILPDWTGVTRYYRDERGLIFKHVETWDMSVFQAFLLTFLPSIARKMRLTEKKNAVS